MRMTNFTPGPWETNDLGKGNAVIVQPVDTSLPPICFVDRQPNVFDNANLIAAAPEMYEALNDAQEELRLIRMKDTNAVYDPTVRIRIEIALAKAEGKQP